MVRLFLGIDLPRKIKEYCAQLQWDFRGVVKGSFPTQDNFHITLKFFSDVPESEINNIMRKLTEVQCKRFELTTENLNYFKRKNTVLFLDIVKNDFLLRLQKDINKLFSDKGDLKGHITLCRAKKIIDEKKFNVLVNKERTSYTFIVRSFSLIKSTLTPEGAIYDTLKTFELQ